jgi:hypothetical protein
MRCRKVVGFSKKRTLNRAAQYGRNKEMYCFLSTIQHRNKLTFFFASNVEIFNIIFSVT